MLGAPLQIECGIPAPWPPQPSEHPIGDAELAAASVGLGALQLCAPHPTNPLQHFISGRWLPIRPYQDEPFWTSAGRKSTAASPRNDGKLPPPSHASEPGTATMKQMLASPAPRQTGPCLLKPENHKTQARKETRRVQVSACIPSVHTCCSKCKSTLCTFKTLG